MHPHFSISKTLVYPVFLLTILASTACSNNPESDSVFPEVKSLADYKQTVVLPTLETAVQSKSNAIYSASLLIAWDEIKNEISEPILTFSSPELELINNTTTHQKVLADSEFNTSVEIEGETIRAKAYFKKSLPFIEPLIKDTKPLPFLNQEVSSFGFYGSNPSSAIAYYNNDDDFAIQLFPKDAEHVIVLIKTNFNDSLVLKTELDKLKEKKNLFKKNRTNKNDWKYYYNHEDRVRIPIIEFNIATNFSNLEGSSFSTRQRDFLLELAYQRTAFVLNEKGAEIESESKVAVTEAMEEEMPKPKRLIFDKPYIILLKRKESLNPYFAMYVSNSELMQKEE